MERVHCTLEDVLHTLSPDGLRAVIFQALVALHAGQALIDFKHHDMHGKNIFVLLLDAAAAARAGKRVKYTALSPEYAWRGQRVAGSTAFRYALIDAGSDASSGTSTVAHFSVPHAGVCIKMGDYDQASAAHPAHRGVRFARSDLELTDVYDDKSGWGPWDGHLVGKHGYDAQYLVGYLLARQRGRMPKAAITWLSSVQALLGGATAVNEDGRPRCGRVSDVPPIDLLLSTDLFGDWRENEGKKVEGSEGVLMYSETTAPS